MQILYCDSCGFRVPDTAISEGRATQVDGKVFCANCKPKTAPVSERPPRPSGINIVAVKRSKPSSGRLVAPDGVGASSAISGRFPSKTEKPNPVTYGVIAGLVGFCILAVAAALLSSGKPAEPRNKPAEPVAKNQERPTVHAPVRDTPIKRPVVESTERIPAPSAPSPEEKQAQDELEKLLRFEGMEDEDAAEKIKRLESYLEKHGQTIVAARARAALSDLKNPKPVVQARNPLEENKQTQPRGENYALSQNGAKASGCDKPEALNDGNSTIFDGDNGFAFALINPAQPMMLTLKEPTALDEIRFRLWDLDDRFYRYKLEVCPDLDDANWRMLADRSGEEAQCKSWQEINFSEQTIHRIRLTGTYTANVHLHVVELEAYRKPSRNEPPRIPAKTVNHASAANGATAQGGINPNQAIDGIANQGNYFKGSLKENPSPPLIVSLKEPTLLDTIHIHLWDHLKRFYRYKVEASPETSGEHWELIADRTSDQDACYGLQVLGFTPRTIGRIRVTGTYNSAQTDFHIMELEAFRLHPPLSAEGGLLHLDTETSGNWKGVYGSEGYYLPGFLGTKPDNFSDTKHAIEKLPSYLPALVRSSNLKSKVWEIPSAKTCALLHPEKNERCLANDTTSTPASYTLHFSDDKTHRVTLYFARSSTPSRDQVVELTEAGSNKLLHRMDTKTLDYSQGFYLVYEVKGQVRFNLIKGPRFDVTLSAIFFDSATTKVAPQTTAQVSRNVFLKMDTETKGNWKGTYGGEGYYLPGFKSDKVSNALSLNLGLWKKPEYLAELNRPQGWHGQVMDLDSKDPILLHHPDKKEERRETLDYCKTDSYMEFKFVDTQPHRVAVYFVRRDTRKRRQNVTLKDMSLGKVIHQIELNEVNFAEGIYLQYELNGHARLELTKDPDSALNAIFAGLFFDKAPTDSPAITIGKEGAAAANITALRKTWAGSLQAGRYDKALEEIDAAAKTASPEVQAALKAERADVEAVRDFVAEAFESLRKKEGETVTITSGGRALVGTVKAGAKPNEVALRMAGGAELYVQREKMEPTDFDALLPLKKADARAEDTRRRGLLFLFAGQGPKAKEYFEQARNAGLGDTAAFYLERASETSLGEQEFSAKKAWERADALMAAKKWREAQEAYELFAKQFETSLIFRQSSKELTERLQTAWQEQNPLKPGLLGEYYRGTVFMDATPLLTRVDPNVAFDWGAGAPATGVPIDEFCVRWTGYIKIGKAGRYQFATKSDEGVRLWIGGKLIIDKWWVMSATRFDVTVDLPEGLHRLQLDYHERTTTASCHLYWAKEGGTEELIPPSVLFHRSSEYRPALSILAKEELTRPGLKAAFFKGKDLQGDLVVRRIDPRVKFDWSGASPESDIPATDFSARWTGLLRIPKSGTYTFAVMADDGMRLWVAGKLVVDDWIAKPASRKEGTLTLDSGFYDIKLEYFQGTVSSKCHLLWALKDGFGEEAIPPEVLCHAIPKEPFAIGADAPNRIYLDDLTEYQYQVEWGRFGRAGDLGYEQNGGTIVLVNGERFTHALSAHASSSLVYRLGRKFKKFEARVALNDAASTFQGAVIFKVLGDGKELWTSQPIKAIKEIKICSVDISGVERLELKAQSENYKYAQAVWLEPMLSR